MYVSVADLLNAGNSLPNKYVELFAIQRTAVVCRDQNGARRLIIITAPAGAVKTVDQRLVRSLGFF